jgi:hypothetical protein
MRTDSHTTHVEQPERIGVLMGHYSTYGPFTMHILILNFIILLWKVCLIINTYETIALLPLEDELFSD